MAASANSQSNNQQTSASGKSRPLADSRERQLSGSRKLNAPSHCKIRVPPSFTAFLCHSFRWTFGLGRKFKGAAGAVTELTAYRVPPAAARQRDRIGSPRNKRIQCNSQLNSTPTPSMAKPPYQSAALGGLSEPPPAPSA